MVGILVNSNAYPRTYPNIVVVEQWKKTLFTLEKLNRVNFVFGLI
jgi:hypothetical protein